MPEKIKDYLTAWQIPFIAAFVAWWLLGAAWLLQRSLQRSLKKRGDRGHQAFSPCVLSLLLAGLGAAVAGGLTFRMAGPIGDRVADIRTMVLGLAIGLAVLLAVSMAFLILYAALQLPVRQLLRVTWPALASVLGVAVLTGVPAFYIGWSIRVNVGRAQTSVLNLSKIDRAIRMYQDFFDRQLPPDLPALTEELTVRGKAKDPLLEKATLQSPFLPNEAVGYFYDPNVPSLDPTNRKSRQLRACEWTHSRSAGYRAMLYANGDAIFTPDRDFQSALNLPENDSFARAFRAADANRR